VSAAALLAGVLSFVAARMIFQWSLTRYRSASS
jgi:ABC-type uncharacterized transport system permease subunit